jgi:CarboxypepD_reg-like domain
MNHGFPRSFLTGMIALLFSLQAMSQEKSFSIAGKIIDEKSGQPLAGASVFCQNTTKGTISDNEGHFSLRLANGGYDLVISYTGYETRLIRVGKGNKETDSMSIALKAEDKSLGEVVVAGSAEVADGWDKYGKFFLDNFIGTTPNAGECVLNNKDAVHFYFYKKRNKLKVKAKDVLNITNNALGYTIKYQLDSFVYDYTENIGSYTGYPLFEELSGTAQQQEAWKKRRAYAYSGSRLHFIRSWYDSTLTDEGFVLERADSGKNNKFSLLKDPYDSSIYAVDSGDVEITMNGKLRVSYANEVPDKKYLEEHRFSPNTRVQISALDVVNGFVIEENGYFYDQSDVTNIGYWSWEKLAEVLPYDYVPE